LIEWDWIGEDSPMMSKGSEAEFVLDRLCESMQRYIKLASTPARDDNDDLKQPPQPRRGFDSGNNEKEQRDVPGSSSGASEDDISPLEKR
jgi:potassium channel subfamily K